MTKAKLTRCHRADSALRESLRVSNFMSRNVQKKVLPSSGLKNEIEGSFGQQGLYIAVDIYESATRSIQWTESGNLRRISILKTAGDCAWRERSSCDCRFETTSRTFLPFGHGRHADSGRFFIGVQMKLMLAYVSKMYEIEPHTVRSVNRWLGGIRLPPFKSHQPTKWGMQILWSWFSNFVIPPLKFTHAFVFFATRVIQVISIEPSHSFETSLLRPFFNANLNILFVFRTYAKSICVAS